MNLPILLQTFFLLLVGHALCDGPLQDAKLSNAKRPGRDPAFPWWLALPAHAGLHAAAVLFVTHSFILAMCEFAAHMTIDAVKGRELIGSIADQSLHVACKVVWLVLLVQGIPGMLGEVR
jgi:hypothetical protein